MKLKLFIILAFLLFKKSYELIVRENDETKIIPYNFSLALRDITLGMNCKALVLYNELTSFGFSEYKVLITSLHKEGVATIYFDNLMSNKIKEKEFIHRYMLYIFYWGSKEASGRFLSALHEAMRVAVITNSRPGTFRLYYNQGKIKDPNKPLPLVNWWREGKLYQTPSLPIPLEVYSDMDGRLFSVPVLHAPPWYYVKLVNKSIIEVTGGRDHQLLALLADKLNFRYRYFDPPQHSQGSGVTANGSFAGVLGMIYRREADFFLGDVSISWERQQGIEFSFLTLADSGAFMTHARRTHSGALALLRPFHWQVWPMIIATIILSGPAVWISAAGPAMLKLKYPRDRPTIGQCVWFTMSIFLKQNSRPPSNSIRTRAVTLLLSFGATYVISDLYSGMLTSLMARPTLEPPLSTLAALEEAMVMRGYHLLVERHSSSLAILQNGTGVYGKLWSLMSQQPESTVRSVEKGARRLLQHHGPPVAILAGRETLYFNTKKFGATNFQLSKKLYTRYSAIAMQIGCPYIENFNRVLMHLFEAGLLDKMTSQEYERFKGDTENDETTNNNIANSESSDNTPNSNTKDSNTQQLDSVNMRMLQGAFYILFLGYGLSGLQVKAVNTFPNVVWSIKIIAAFLIFKSK